MSVNIDPNTKEIVGVPFNELSDFPSPFYLGFANFCEGRLIMGAGMVNILRTLNSVHEVDQDYGMLSLPSLNTPRSRCASAYHDGKLFVTGGWDDSNKLDSIEYLSISAAENGSAWVQCTSKLPYKAVSYTHLTLTTICSV